MRITRVETIPVRVPLRAGLTTKTAHGEHVDSHYVIVRLRTDAGLVGLGEATVDPLWSGETAKGFVIAVEQILAPLLVGADPMELTVLRSRMDRKLKLNPFTKAAIDMALWDLAGKAAGVPVCQLLGGKVRSAIPIKMVVGAFDVRKAVELAERFLKWGVKCLKVKVGLDPAGDVERVKVVREVAGPNIPIGIDANCGWNATRARQMLARLEPFNVLFAEQPIPPGDAKLLAEVRRSTRIPIMADESIFTLTDAWNLATARAADILSIYPGKHGGLAASVEIAHVAQAAGMVCAIGSNLELGIGTAAMLHVAAAFPEVDTDSFPADTIGPFYHEADLITKPLDLGPPYAKVPDGPGLGVELDEAQLKKWLIA